MYGEDNLPKVNPEFPGFSPIINYQCNCEKERKIVDYIICNDNRIQALRYEVIRLIKKGFIPTGGVSELSCNERPGCIYVQTMVKYED